VKKPAAWKMPSKLPNLPSAFQLILSQLWTPYNIFLFFFINFTKKAISSLPANSFYDWTILRLVLNRNTLTRIEENAFNGVLLDSLVELDLSDNSLAQIANQVKPCPNFFSIYFFAAWWPFTITKFAQTLPQSKWYLPNACRNVRPICQPGNSSQIGTAWQSTDRPIFGGRRGRRQCIFPIEKSPGIEFGGQSAEYGAQWRIECPKANLDQFEFGPKPGK
jgi:hypothetical protein